MIDRLVYSHSRELRVDSCFKCSIYWKYATKKKKNSKRPIKI